MKDLLNLNNYRDLLLLWTAREISIRHKQSLLGIAWAVLQPLALTLIFTIVFSYIVQIDTGDVPYPIFAYSALVPWAFFSTSLSFGIPSLVNNMNLVTKIYFPREILPIASIGAAFIDFLIAGAIFIGMMFFYRVPVGLTVLWIVPLLAVQIILTMGVTLLGAMVLVFFRDMRFVLPLLIQIWMYASPVIYPLDMVPQPLRPFYFLNPMVAVISGYRSVLILGEPPLVEPLALATAISLLIFVIGYSAFKRAEPIFADLI